MASQQGRFFNGTFGYPIKVRVGVPLTSITAIALTIVRPNGFGNLDKTLSAGDITNVNAGEITYTLEEGDLPTPGRYLIKLVIDKSGSRRLTAEAPMDVG